MDAVGNAFAARQRRVTRETNPAPTDMVASGKGHRTRLPARLDIWLRLHPNGPRLVALVVVAVVLMACTVLR